MLASQTIDGLIVKDPALRGGRPIIAGTGVTVRTIVGYYKLLNTRSAAEMRDRLEYLSNWR
jgi:uncharacterized protein (DUF433 family)